MIRTVVYTSGRVDTYEADPTDIEQDPEWVYGPVVDGDASPLRPFRRDASTPNDAPVYREETW